MPHSVKGLDRSIAEQVRGGKQIWLAGGQQWFTLGSHYRIQYVTPMSCDVELHSDVFGTSKCGVPLKPRTRQLVQFPFYNEELVSQFVEDVVKMINSKLREETSATARALWDVYQECQSADWDGYGARAVTRDAYDDAKRFYEILPASVPPAEVTAIPSGEIAFEWYKESGNVFVVTVGSGNRLVYAGIFGPNETHGVEYYGDAVPDVILDFLKRLYPHELAAK